jgi:hypothetical protein
MAHPWQPPVTWFALFNLLAAPLIGRAVWMVMQQLNAESAVAAAVGLSLAGAIGILGVNVTLSWWATRAGLPRHGQMALWLITGGTFVLTVGFGFFSPVNLLTALIRNGSG